MPKKKSSSKDKAPKFSFINVTKHKDDLRKKEPPLVDIEVSNPLTYLKSWWKKVIGNEGIDLRFRIKPLTAITISAVVATIGFGIGRFVVSLKKPYITYVPIKETAPTPLPTVSPWRETGFVGRITKADNGRYYLLTSDDEALNLTGGSKAKLEELLDKKVFITGNYHNRLHVLELGEISEFEE